MSNSGDTTGILVPRSVAFREALKNHPLLLALTFAVAGCSIVYELLIAHALALLAANALVWYSLVIGFYLLGMGIGSLLVDRFSPLSGVLAGKIAWRNLAVIELLLSLSGAIAIPLLHSAHSLYAFMDHWGYTNTGLCLFFGTALGHTLLIGVLTGIELPLLIILGKSASGSKSATNAVLAFDYFGSLAGAVTFPLLLLPHLSLLLIGAFIASMNLIAAILIATLNSPQKLRSGVVLSGNLLFLFYTSMFFFEANIEQFFLKRYYCYRLLSRSLDDYFSLGSEYPDILRVRSPYQMIDVLHDMEGDGTDPFVQAYSSKFTTNPDWPHNRLLFLNGDWQFHSNHEEIYHEWFAHVPIMSSGKVPKNVLVLGGGDGLLIRELVRYPGIESITHVDLDEKLIVLAKTHSLLLTLNKSALLDPRVHTIIADGMHYVRTNKQIYDAIYIDFPTPTDYDLAKLYSREFYHFVRQRLHPSGFAVFDSVSTGALLLPDENGIQRLSDRNFWLNYYHTLRAAGFTRIVPYNSTMEFAQPQALQQARSVYSEEDALHRVNTYVLQRQQGFIMVGLPGTYFGGNYKRPPGADLNALTEQRYSRAFEVSYPFDEEIDYSKVNSVFRPALPIMPVWNARLPF